MSATVPALADALGARLDAVNIRNLPYLGDAFSPPVALIGVDTVQYHEAFGSTPLAGHNFTVFVIVSRADDRSGLAALEGYMSNSGDTSLRVALEADQSLGGIAASSLVTEAGPPASINVNGANYLSCPFKVVVHAE